MRDSFNAEKPIVSLGMARFDIYIKLEMDTKGEEDPGKLAGELCRQLLKMYGVRSAEMVNYVLQE